MFQVEVGGTARYCDGVSRRSFLQLGVAGMASLSLADVMRAKAAISGEGSAGSRKAKDASVILLWLDGGPSHMDLWDMKPDAPAAYRSIWQPISTNVPGIEISELFPKKARVADKFSIIRSLHHDNGDHFTAAHLLLTGRGGASGSNTAGKLPGISSIAAKMCGSRRPGIPAHIAVPYSSTVGLRPGYFGANYLGPRYDPFETGGDPNQDNFKVPNLGLASGLTMQRIEDRRTLREHFDQTQHAVDSGGLMDSMDRFERDAYELVMSPKVRDAFDIGREGKEVREMYGRNDWGQSTLLARRLVEAGATFVTVHMGGWDHHWDLQAGMERYLPRVDSAVAGLFTDLSQRGLLDKVLVVVCGEFSRSPRMNDGSGKGTPGRDHWGNSMSVLIGGGGVQGGRIIGSTDRYGEAPKDHPLRPGDLHHTIYKVLGVDPNVSFLDRSGRPVAAIDHGQVIGELF
jgi:hypothetical protein